MQQSGHAENSCARLSHSLPIAFPNMRVGLLGGTFNPAHEGHLNISLMALKRLKLDQVWWLVTPGNPLKDRSGLAGTDVRGGAALKLVNHPRIFITDFERYLPSPYAIDSIRFLKERYRQMRFVWIIGGDNLVGFHRWLRWDDIIRALPVLVVDRPRCRHAALASKTAQRFAAARLPEHEAASLPERAAPAWCYLTVPLSDISSTQIRRSGD